MREGKKSGVLVVDREPQTIPEALLAARHTAEFWRRTLEYSWDLKKLKMIKSHKCFQVIFSSHMRERPKGVLFDLIFGFFHLGTSRAFSAIQRYRFVHGHVHIFIPMPWGHLFCPIPWRHVVRIHFCIFPLGDL